MTILLSLIVVILMWFLRSASSTEYNFTVAKDGSGDFKTITKAVRAAPEFSLSRFTIFIKAGTYKEYVTVDKKKVNISFIGEGMESTIITGNRRSTIGGLHTYETGTVTINGDGFMAQDITFQNTATKSPAVALLSEADRCAFFRCKFFGFQDTLYAKGGIQFFRECEVYGTIDFICGDATAVFQNCAIYARNSPSNLVTITAQARDNEQGKSGYVLHNCTIEATIGIDSTVQVYMGRPWRNYSRVVVMQTYLDEVVNSSGWLEWKGNEEYDSTLYYAEYDNWGPAANTTSRVHWQGYQGVIPRYIARQFSVRNFIHGDEWIPSTGIPFDLDLILETEAHRGQGNTKIPLPFFTIFILPLLITLFLFGKLCRNPMKLGLLAKSINSLY